MPECSNIDLMIDEYLEKKTSVVTEAEGEKSEEDASEVFREFMDIQRQTVMDTKKKYDISDYEEDYIARNITIFANNTQNVKLN